MVLQSLLAAELSGESISIAASDQRTGLGLILELFFVAANCALMPQRCQVCPGPRLSPVPLGQWFSQPPTAASLGHGNDLTWLNADLCQVKPSALNAFSVLVPNQLLN